MGIWGGPGRGAITNRRPWPLVAVLVGPLAAACSSPDGRQSTPNSQGPAGPPQAENLVGETIVPAIAG